MKYTVQNIQSVDYVSIVNDIRSSEQSRDFDQAIMAFRLVWDNFELDPDFSFFSPAQQAELYRLSGNFLCHYGKLKNRANYQERGKDLLTKSIEIYRSFNDYEGVADAQNTLGMCYIHEGSILEAEAVLEQTADDFLHDNLNLRYLQNRGNLLITKLYLKKYVEALRIIEEITVPMEFCQDKKACQVFHEKAGNLFRRIKQFNRAEFHYLQAIDFAQELNNKSFISSISNNLALLYLQTGNLETATKFIDKAIHLAIEHNLNGFLPHFLDTKAGIFFEEGNYKKALETIDQAIEIFQKGEDVAALLESLWNKCKFLLYSEQKAEAMGIFADLSILASQKMCTFALNNITSEFAEIIHIKKEGSLVEETRRFRRVEVINSIRKADYQIPAAAQSLQISSELLAEIIDHEFPDLFAEINLERFTALDKQSQTTQENFDRNISRISLTKTNTNLPESVTTFYFNKEIMQQHFGASLDAVLAFNSGDNIEPGERVLVQNKINAKCSYGIINFDRKLNLYYLSDQKEPLAFTLEEVEIFNQIAGYLPFSEIDDQILNFRLISSEPIPSSLA